MATLDALFARANAGQSTTLPAVDGPCLYFRRDCLDAVGAFDSRPLGSDYGVEIDFCLRAGSAGFRHLLAGDVFVGHGGHASFGEQQAKEMKGRTELALYKLFPAYAMQKKEALEREPGRPFARRVDLLRLADLPRQMVVFVSHPWGGGIRRYMNDLATLAGERCEVLHLEPASGDTVKLYWPRAAESFAAYFTLPGELPILAETLRAIGVARLHFHHVHLLPRAILDLPSAVGVPYDCTLHDYYPICPQYHLVTEDGNYCGEPDATGCAACLTRRPGQWGLDITAWRGAFGQLLRGADRIIAPSHDVASRMRRYFPEIAINVWPHPEPSPAPLPRVARVAVLGNLSPEKGLHVVAACARDARDRGLPLVFRLLGSTTEPVPQAPDAPLTIYGQYVDAELPRLIAEEKPDVLLFAAQVPETYAYTLSVALDSGLPIVATALGAFTERLAGRPRTATVPWNAPPSVWNSALLTAAGFAERPAAIAVAAAGQGDDLMDPSRYSALYLAPFPSTPRARNPRADVPALAAHHFYLEEGRVETPRLSLPQLYTAGVECGHTEARLELDAPRGRRRHAARGISRDPRSRAGRPRASGGRAPVGTARAAQDADAHGPRRDVARRRAPPDRRARAIDDVACVGAIPQRGPSLQGRWRRACARAGLPCAARRSSSRRPCSIFRNEGTEAAFQRAWAKVNGQGRFKPSRAAMFRLEEEVTPLAFPASDTPQVSIVIPVYGNPLLTFTCLKSVQAHTPAGHYEIIVVDDASPDPVAEQLKDVTGDPHRAQSGEPGLHRHVQPRRRTRARRDSSSSSTTTRS